MPKEMCCPYFSYEIVKNDARVGVKCKGATIRFPNKEARRMFVYPYCGSVKGFNECPVYKFLESSGQ
ncbi:MAG: hypothetical protein IJD91_01235 [Clostridia bacterium]|nr:hypothetical protein [Clostridia bacterium]